MKRLGTPLATLVLLFLAACLWAGAAPSQESPASPSPAASPLVPRTQDLPPLELPPIPEEEGAGVEDEPGQPGMEEVPEAPASPAQAPAPLPVPTGTPLVKPDLPIGGVRFYALEYDGHLVGYSRYEVERLMELGGQSSYLLREESRIKLGLGAIDDARFTAKLMVNRKDLTPTYFICAQGEEGKGLGVECVYTQSMVAQKNLLGSSQTHHFHNYEGRAPLLVFNNLWGHLDTFPDHYWLLVRSAA
ncbi:MAG TPA: hypothetical protein VNO81_07910, partial [Candidatus Nitrosotenuis sp.]|nr:hypothetical protein [Candidatus Nitrosotenuis sp.]